MGTSAWHDTADEIQALVDELAERLGRSVVIDDPLVRLMYASRHFSDEDPARIRALLQRDAGADVIAFVLAQGVACWSRAGMLPAAPEHDLLPRLCAPLRGNGQFLGMIMVIDRDGSLTTDDVTTVEAAASAISAILAARAATSDATRAERERAVRRLVSSEDQERSAAAEQLREAGFPDRPHLTVTLVEAASDLHSSAQLALALRSVQRQIETTPRVPGAGAMAGSQAILLQHRAAAPDFGQLAGIRGMLRQTLGAASRISIGAGAPVERLADARRACRQAEAALRAARRLPRLQGIGIWEALGEFATLSALPDDFPPGAPAERAVEALACHEAGKRLLETARTYLDMAGSAPRTANALHLHRTSLYYRLRQIQDITGLDLDDGRDRLLLHLGLRLAELSPPGTTMTGSKP
jgi:hypothetical protein